MSAVFWFSLVAGAGLLLLSLVGDIFGGDALDAANATDGVGGLQTDVDGFDTEADHVNGGGLAAVKVLSIRNATYFLFGFGAVGVLLNWFWQGEHGLVVLAAAAGTGIAAAAISALAFGYVRNTDSGYLPTDRTLMGLVGSVTLPLAVRGTGKILVKRGGRTRELLARPFDPAAIEPGDWRSVVIVELEDGVALVAPYQDGLESGDETLSG